MSRELVDTQLLAENARLMEVELRADPDAGMVRPWLSARLERNVRSQAGFVQYGNEYEFASDEAKERGGADSSPSPLRYLLASIAFCFQGWCAKTWAIEGEELSALNVDVRTMLDMRGELLIEGVPPYPQWFVLDVQLESPASPDSVARLLREALGRCPVTSLVLRSVPIYLRAEQNHVLMLDERPADLRREQEQEKPR